MLVLTRLTNEGIEIGNGIIWVCRFIGTTAICRADDGSTFRRENGPAKPRQKSARCLIRIHGVATPFSGVVVPDKRWLRAKVTQNHPIWRGCEVDERSAEITLLGATA